MSAAPVRSHTPLDEYLALEAASVGQKPKLEYDGNDIVLMAGGTPNHGIVTTRLLLKIAPPFLDRGCAVISSDLRVKVDTKYRYPDIVAYCPPAQFTDERPPSLLNPILLVEVLSETTANTDLSLKLKEYTSIESVHEYWIASQDAPVIYRYVRAPEAWTVHLYEGFDATFTSAALELSIRLADVYDGVDFTPTTPTEPA